MEIKRNPSWFVAGTQRAAEFSKKAALARWKNHIPTSKTHKVTPESKEKHRLRMRIWRSKNKDKDLICKKRYKARKKGASGFHTSEEWNLLKELHGYKCLKCGRKEPTIKLTEDHIVPLSKGGSDYIENIQPLCRSCNTSKGVKTIYFNLNPMTRQVIAS